MPARSVNTYIFTIDQASTAIEELTQTEDVEVKAYYDMQGRRLNTPRGMCIEKRSDGTSRKVYIDD